MMEKGTKVYNSQKMLRGSKIRIFPTRRQSERMDLWRRRTLSLWNLLLELEQAAYSGDNTRSDIAWRSIWAQVVEERHVNAVETYQHGKIRKDPPNDASTCGLSRGDGLNAPGGVCHAASDRDARQQGSHP